MFSVTVNRQIYKNQKITLKVPISIPKEKETAIHEAKTHKFNSFPSRDFVKMIAKKNMVYVGWDNNKAN